MAEATRTAASFIPEHSRCANVIHTATELSTNPAGGNIIRQSFGDMSVVHTVNNLGLVAWALQGKPLPSHWSVPWQNRIGVSLASYAELSVNDLANRTLAVAQQLG